MKTKVDADPCPHTKLRHDDLLACGLKRRTPGDCICAVCRKPVEAWWNWGRVKEIGTRGQTDTRESLKSQR